MLKRILMLLVTGFVVVLALAACGGAEPTATPVPPTATAVPTTPTPVPPTPVPPTPTPLPTATPEPPRLGDNVQRYSNAALGLSFDHPADWMVESLFDVFVILASDPDLLGDGIENLGTLTDGAVIFATAGPSAEMPDVSTAADEFGEDVTLLEGPDVIMVGGLPAQRAVFSAEAEGETGVLLVTIVPSGDFTFLFIGATTKESAEQYLPIIDAVIASAELGTPDPSLSDFFGEGDDFFGFGGNLAPTSWESLAVGDTLSGDLTGPLGFELDLSADTTYAFIVGGSGDLLFSINEADQELARVDDRMEGELEVLFWQPPADGTYRLNAGVWDADGSDYLIAVVPAQTAQDESLSFGFETGQLPFIYAVSPDEIDIVLIISSDDDPDFDPLRVDSAYDVERHLLQDVPPGGYTAAVEGYSETVSAYSVSVALIDPLFLTVAPKPDIFDPTTAADGGALAVNDIAETEEAVAVAFRAELTADVPYLIVAGSQSEADTLLKLYAEDGSILLSEDSGVRGQPESTVWLPDSDQTITVLVSDYSGSPSVFQVALFAFEEWTDGTELEVTVTADSAPVIYARPLEDGDTVITILDAGGNEAAYVDDTVSGEVEVYRMFDLPPGTYTVQVTDYYDESTAFEIAVVYLDPQRFAEPPEVFDPASAVDGGQLAVGTVTTGAAAERIAFTIELAADTTYLAIAGANNSADTFFTVYGPDNAAIQQVDATFAAQPESLVWRTTAAGTYTIAVRDYSGGSARFSVGVYALDDLSTTLRQTVTVTADRFPVIVAVPPQTIDAVINVRDGANDVSSADRGYTGDPEVLVLFEAAPGEYTATAEAFGGGAGRGIRMGVILVERNLFVGR